MGETFFCEHGLKLDELPWGPPYDVEPWAPGRHGVRRVAALRIDGDVFYFYAWGSGAFEIEQPGGVEYAYALPGDLLLAAVQVIELTKGKTIS